MTPLVGAEAVKQAMEDLFTIESLAAYLHLDAAQISRLAERGNLPGRRIGGAWRFSKPEIHHWLERRIGLSGDDELALMENALERPDLRTDAETLSIADMLPLEAIAAPLPARTRNSVIDSMTELAAQTGWLWDPPKMAEAIRNREEMHPTALDNGVALLHPRRPMPAILGQAFLALGITGQGIPFGGSRGVLTDTFFLICSLEDRSHLRVLARLSRIINDAELMAGLRSAPDAVAVHALIAERERLITG